MPVVHSVNIMILILLISVGIVIYYILKYDGSKVESVANRMVTFSNRTKHAGLVIGQMTKKKEEREYAKNREEYFREFHRVIAPVVVLKVEGKDD